MNTRQNIPGISRDVLLAARKALAHAACWIALAVALPASADVTVAQTPLTKPPSIKPNIMMILDDSGSMAWSVMPDSPSNTGKNTGLISSSVNGVYYNPTTDYKPPYAVTAHPDAAAPTFDRYPAASFDSAWTNGFKQSDGSYNIATYKGSDDSSPISAKPAFSHTFQVKDSGTYDRTDATCASGTAVFSDATHPGKCKIENDQQDPDCPNGYSLSGGSCVSNYSTRDPSCPNGYVFNDNPGSATAGECVKSSTPDCSTGTLVNNTGDWSNATCRTGSSRRGYTYNTDWLDCDNGLDVDLNGLEPYNNNPDNLKYRQCYRIRDDGYPRCSGDRTLQGTGAGRICAYPPADPDCDDHPGYTYDSSSGMCVGTAYTDPQCPSTPVDYDLYNAGTANVECRHILTPGSTVYRSLFVYTIKNADGTYTPHFVGAASEDTSKDSGCAKYNNWGGGCQTTLPDNGYPGAGTCDDITSNPVTDLDTGDSYASGVPVAQCHGGIEDGVNDDDDNAVRQNVANWFSYYRTRILMAKSGLMNAFATLDENIRFGFGSIDDNNDDNVPSPATSNPKLSKVKPFGDGTDGTRRQQFWSWVAGSKANSGTPLRKALKVAGDYYKGDDQPWTSGDDAPECDGKSGTDLSDCEAQKLACRQSYTILTTDGFWNSDTITLDGSSYRVDGHDYDGDWDGGPSAGSPVKHTDSNSVEYIYKAVAPYSGDQAKDGTSTLADVAMYYWLADLRTDLANSVPTNSDDPAFWQHMTTFTVGLFDQDTSFSYKRTDNGSTTSTTPETIAAWAKGGAAVPFFQWPTPSGTGNGVAENISDLVHAGLNGHGGFYSAGNPDAFASGIQDALRRVAQNIGSGASLAANSTKLDTGTTTYQAIYFTGTWKGDLRAFPVNSDGTIATNSSWTASEQMPAAADRTIKTCTGNCTGSGSSIFVDFSTAATFDAKNDLCTTSGACGTTEANDKINYLRGDHSEEQTAGGPYRNRTTALGDIVDSQPVFVGTPNGNLYANKSFSSEYAAFATDDDRLTRRKQIYVASNDGMLHAFNAETSGTDPVPGQETFAYLPKAVIKSGLRKLALPNYGDAANPHQYFNDGELTVADVKDGSTWKTVLVGTTGRGPAQAVYALDVTDPDDVKLLWERSAGDGQSNDDYIGRIVGKPVLARVTGGTWVALMGNGYNSPHDGKPALLQFDITTGNLSVYTTGGVTNDGLSAPAVWISDDTVNDNISTQAYAGDLHGNVWAFDLTASGGTGSKIFIAKNSDGTKTQPITAGLVVAKNPADSRVWVFFGTGSNLSQFDTGDGVQTWYGLIVQGTNDEDTNKVGCTDSTSCTPRSDLKHRTIVAENVASDTRLAARGITPATAGDMTDEKGWYIDLLPPGGTAQGERMVTPNQFQGSLLIGTSRLPTGSADPCNPSGAGWIMAVNPFTGTPADTPFFDINNDGSFTDDAGGDNVTKDSTGYQSDGDNVVVAGVGFSSIANNPIFVGHTMLISFDNAKTGNVNTRGTVGVLKRVSWRELVTQ